MKVILKQEVKNLGKEWDMVTVADGYARNFLLPRNMAMAATQASVKDLERRRQQASVRRQHEEEGARALATRMEDLPVMITARCGPEGRLYGSVTSSDIADFLETKGFQVDRRRIEIAEPIRTIGEHHVNVQLHSNVSVHLRVQVNPEGGMPVQPAAANAQTETTAPANLAGEETESEEAEDVPEA